MASIGAKDIQEMIDEGIDAILLTPVNWEEITPSLQALQEAGIKILNVDAQVKEMDYVDAYIGSDNYTAGQLCGEDLMEKQPEGGKFERALEETQEILKEFPDLTAIMCGNDQMAVGAKTAVNLAEMKDVIIYGVDGSPDIKKELKKTGNQIAGTAAQSPINMGKSAAELVLKMLKGEPFERETYEEVFMINAENVDMYGTDQFLRGSAGREVLQSSAVPGGRGEALPGISHGRGLRGSALSCAGGSG